MSVVFVFQIPEDFVKKLTVSFHKHIFNFWVLVSCPLPIPSDNIGLLFYKLNIFYFLKKKQSINKGKPLFVYSCILRLEWKLWNAKTRVRLRLSFKSRMLPMTLWWWQSDDDKDSRRHRSWPLLGDLWGLWCFELLTFITSFKQFND